MMHDLTVLGVMMRDAELSEAVPDTLELLLRACLDARQIGMLYYVETSHFR